MFTLARRVMLLAILSNMAYAVQLSVSREGKFQMCVSEGRTKHPRNKAVTAENEWWWEEG